MLSSIESHDIKKLSYVCLRSTAEDLLQGFNYSHTYIWMNCHPYLACFQQWLQKRSSEKPDGFLQGRSFPICNSKGFEQRGCIRQGCMVLKCYTFFWQLQITEGGCLSLTIFRICLKTSSIELS
jgi:hypothetical protein